MSKEHDGGPAFPTNATIVRMDGAEQKIIAAGMPLRAYAAIKLRIPESGIDWLDEMIAKAQRRDIAVAALQGYLTMFGGPDLDAPDYKEAAENDQAYSDSMLQEQEKK